MRAMRRAAAVAATGTLLGSLLPAGYASAADQTFWNGKYRTTNCAGYNNGYVSVYYGTPNSPNKCRYRNITEGRDSNLRTVHTSEPQTRQDTFIGGPIVGVSLSQHGSRSLRNNFYSNITIYTCAKTNYKLPRFRTVPRGQFRYGRANFMSLWSNPCI